MIVNQAKALEELKEILGVHNVTTNPEILKSETENSLGLKRHIIGIVYPSDTEEVREIIRIANVYRIPLYPVSRGMNIGYGDKVPVSDGQLIINLQKMTAIREFNPVSGRVTVEPGVTQIQLYKFLKDKNADFWLDVTGAGLESSIIGNSLEGGFGHTPKGNRRETTSDYEVVLGNGEIIKTGTFPGLGPDMKGLFIQSNFGIITSAEIELMPAPEHFESFIISVYNDQGLEPLMDALRFLRQMETVTSLVHIANAIRSFMTISDCPDEYKESLISSSTAQKLSGSSLLKVGYWSAVGGLYGSPSEIKSKKREIRKKLSSNLKVTFLNDSKIKFIKRLVSKWPLNRLKSADKIYKSINSYEHIHGIMQGKPSDLALKNIKWRVKNSDHTGLIWISPTVPATAQRIWRVLNITKPLFNEMGFEMPVTITMIKSDRVVIIISIVFDKNHQEEKNRAHQLYDMCSQSFAEAGIELYRMNLLGMETMKTNNNGRYKVLRQLKNVFDPNNIIAPGRYGI